MSLASGQSPLPDPVPVLAPAASNAVAPSTKDITGTATVIPATPIVAGGCLDTCLPRCNGGWSVGGGVYVMQPFFGSNPAFFTQRTVGGATVTHQQDFSSEISVAPLAYLGYTWANGWGIRGRWFEFTSSGSAGSPINSSTTVFDATSVLGALPAPAGTTATAIASSRMILSVYDLEATYARTFDQWSFLFSAGVRYAHLSQDYSISVTDAGANLGSVASSQTFNGLGPTLALEAHRQLGSSDFALYGSARGSLLFGTLDQDSSASPVIRGGSSSSTDVLPIGELEMGGEWGHTCERFRFSAQLGVVGQIWWGGGNASQGAYLNTINIGGLPPSSAGNFGFIGGVFRAGVSF